MKKSTIILTLMLLSLAAVFGQTNVAYTKSLTATGFSSTSNPLNAVDNSYSTTYAVVGNGGISLTIDLGTIFPINWVNVLFVGNAPLGCSIYSSIDGVNYTYIGACTPSTSQLSKTAITTLPNNLNQHRFIKLVFFNPSGTHNYNIGEIEVICNSCITMGYTYDGQGNRISRSITLPPPGLKSAVAIYDSTTQALKKEFIPENTFTHAVGESKVSIYPNPTRGELVVQVTNPNADATHGIMLFDANGALIYQKEKATEYTDVDITNKPAGLYILKILDGENSTTWKIIKQ